MSRTSRTQREAPKWAWSAIVGSFICHFVSFGLTYSFGVLFPYISEEFNAGRGLTAGVGGLTSAVLLGVSGLAGRAADRVGASRVVAGGAVIICTALGMASVASNLGHLYLAYGVLLGLGVSWCFVPSLSVVASATAYGHKGLSLGLAAAGAGVGTLAIASLLSLLIDRLGWRLSLRVLATLSLCLLLLSAMLLSRVARSTPKDSHRHEVVPLWRLPGFPRLYTALLACGYGYYVPFVHLVPLARDRGWSITHASILLGILGIGSTGGRVVFGAVGDRVGRSSALAASLAGMALAVLSLPVGPIGLVGGTVVFGCCAGALVALVPAVADDLAAPGQGGRTTGTLYTALAAGSLLGPAITGWLFDRHGSYTAPLAVAGGFLALGALVIRPKQTVGKRSHAE